jgi:hypothetical protein
MKRDEHGRRVTTPSGKFHVDASYESEYGDNLSPDTEDDESTENDHYNWVNNPVRQMFENPRQQSHRTHLEYERKNDTE